MFGSTDRLEVSSKSHFCRKQLHFSMVLLNFSFPPLHINIISTKYSTFLWKNQPATKHLSRQMSLSPRLLPWYPLARSSQRSGCPTSSWGPDFMRIQEAHPPNATPTGNKALVRDYKPLRSLHKALFPGGVSIGRDGTLRFPWWLYQHIFPPAYHSKRDSMGRIVKMTLWLDHQNKKWRDFIVWAWWLGNTILHIYNYIYTVYINASPPKKKIWNNIPWTLPKLL